MMEIVNQWMQERMPGRCERRESQRGQSLIVITFAFIALLAFVGLGVDLGWVYVERIRASQAADAAALAAASELPVEEAAHLRAKVYLRENGYDYTRDDTIVVTNTYEDGSYTSDPAGPDTETTIWIDTEYSRDLAAENPETTATRIRVRVRRRVFMHFMQFVGFEYFPVEATAEAENIDDIDTVIVYDDSGSMEFDTLCYGCWKSEDDDPSCDNPDGCIYPLHWSNTSTTNADHCAGWDSDDGYDCSGGNNCYYEDSGEYYTVIEAEEYSWYEPAAADYHALGAYKANYWIMQRNGGQGRPGYSAYISHRPSYAEAQGRGVNCTEEGLADTSCDGLRCCTSEKAFPAPRVDYDFYAPANGPYYVWIRAEGGEDSDQNHVFWDVDGNSPTRADGFDYGPSYGYDGAGDFDWECLGEVGSGWSSGSAHTLKLWAGGAGFSVDRLLITTDNDGDYGDACSYNDWPPGSYENDNPNNGRTRLACDRCDPRFAGRPGGECKDGVCFPDCDTDMQSDYLYDEFHGEQPIRASLEAAEYFVGLLDHKHDQVGYVRYDGSASVPSDLQCLRQPGPCTSQVFTSTIASALESSEAGGSTNLADGMERGINGVLLDEDYGRPGAARVMVLMTDGRANAVPNSTCHSDAYLWPTEPGVSEDPRPAYGEDEQEAADCVMYYANEARNEGIVVYTIALGKGADHQLLRAVAERTGGQYFFADPRSPGAMKEVFDELYERIFIRMTK